MCRAYIIRKLIEMDRERVKKTFYYYGPFKFEELNYYCDRKVIFKNVFS